MTPKAKNILINTLIFGTLIFTVYHISKKNISEIKDDLKTNFGL